MSTRMQVTDAPGSASVMRHYHAPFQREEDTRIVLR